MFPLSCGVCARTRLSETAHTHKFTAHKHIMMKQCSRLASWGKLFSDLLKQGFLTRGDGLMNKKLDICGRDDLFFYSWVVAQTLVISKKVRTRQSFCAHRLQKIRGNIGSIHSFFAPYIVIHQRIFFTWVIYCLLFTDCT